MRHVLPALLLGCSLLAAQGDAGGGPAARLLAAAADADRDGAVSAEEWSAFLGRLADAGERLDRARLKAVLLRPALDANGDGAVDATELEAALARDAAGRRGAGGGAAATAVVRRAADSDGDGAIGEDERAGLVARHETGLTLDDLAEWVVLAEQDVPDDRNAFTVSTWLATLDGQLDADRDGALTRDDLGALFAGLDADGNGALDAAELRPSREPRRTRGNFETATEADRRRPPLIAWQRDLDDAWALVQRTGKPLLVCVNMDGETASEALAWVRYRDPAFAALTAGFVCVIASPDRHTARDHDDRGRRIEDPRFGRVVCAEHIDVEPLVFERFFDGRRVAPRHVGVAPDGKVLFDIYLVNDLTIVDRALAEHGRFDVTAAEADSLDTAALLDSPEAAHRAELEARFLAAAESERVRLAGLAQAQDRTTRHPELIRLALRDPSGTVQDAAVAALAAGGRADSLPLVREAFRVAFGDPTATEGLVGWLDRVAEQADTAELRDRAARERDLQSGLAATSSSIDVASWIAALDGAGEPESAAAPEERDRLDAALDAVAKARGSRPDRELDLEAAWLTLRYAEATRAARGDPTFLFDDAIALARRAIEAGSTDPRAPAIAASASYQIGEVEAALGFAGRALPGLTRHAGSRLAADVLASVAREGAREIYDAMAEERPIPAARVGEVRAAFEVLFRHPAASEDLLATGLDWLDVVGGWGLEGELVRIAIERFPASPAMHERLRGQLLRDAGAAALEADYAVLEPDGVDHATLDWFRGLAFYVAGDRHAEDGRDEEARRAYARSAGAFESALTQRPDFEASTRAWLDAARERAAR